MADVGAKLPYPVPAAIAVDNVYHPLVVDGAVIELEMNAFHPSNEGVVDRGLLYIAPM